MEFKASEFALEDVIMSMPDNVITDIMDRLPLQEAVRTCVLSRNWRLKWTMLSQLIFDENFFKYLLKTHNQYKYGRIINSLLLHHKGVITKFELSADKHAFFMLGMEDKHAFFGSNLDDIEHWILYLSRNGIKDLTFAKRRGPPVLLPAYIFSCLELKHLKLLNCVIALPASFHGFPNLLSLELDLDLELSDSSKLGKYISMCPLLEILNMCFTWGLSVSVIRHTDISLKGKVKLDEMAKLTNLRILYFSLCQLDNIMKITNSSIVFELMGVLPKLQQLYLDFVMCKFTEDGAKKSPLAIFPCLETLKLSRIDLDDDIMLSCAFELIKCCPNLQTLKITTTEYDDAPTPEIYSREVVDYKTMALLQLRSVVFTDLKGSENELCLIKYLLACSPFLNKLGIRSHSNAKSVLASKLSKLHRASPTVDIDLN